MTDQPSNVDFDAFAKRIADARDAMRPEPLPKGGGGGTSDGMDGHIQRLDDKIDNRFFWLLGTFGAGFMILLSAFAAGFLTLSAKMDDRTDKLSAEIRTVGAQVSQVGERVAKLEGAAEKSPPVTKKD